MKLGEVVELFVSREQAEQTMCEVIDDEPELAAILRIVKVDLSGARD